MKAERFEFQRNFLKHTNFKNGYHVYTNMKTVSDQSGAELPASVIRLLYQIGTEAQKEDQRKRKTENGRSIYVPKDQFTQSDQ